jgi:hypothetical protein
MDVEEETLYLTGVTSVPCQVLQTNGLRREKGGGGRGRSVGGGGGEREIIRPSPEKYGLLQI